MSAVPKRESGELAYRNGITDLDGTVLMWMRVVVVQKGLRRMTILLGERVRRARARHRCSRCNSGGQW